MKSEQKNEKENFRVKSLVLKKTQIADEWLIIELLHLKFIGIRMHLVFFIIILYISLAATAMQIGTWRYHEELCRSE